MPEGVWAGGHPSCGRKNQYRRWREIRGDVKRRSGDWVAIGEANKGGVWGSGGKRVITYSYPSTLLWGTCWRGGGARRHSIV